jgi:hypothetical protein
VSRRPQQTISLPCGPECRAYHSVSEAAEVLHVGLRQAYRLTLPFRRRDRGLIRCDLLRELTRELFEPPPSQ